MVKFNCDKCSSCCHHIAALLDNVDNLKEPFKTEVKDFPYIAVNGKCEKLTNKGFCKVYTKRPDLCNVDLLYEKYFKDTMTRKEYYINNKKYCKLWQYQQSQQQ